MISGRFLSIVCALVGVTLVPTLIHSYAEFAVHDGLTAQAIPDSLVGYPCTPSGRNETWGERKFESFDWVERMCKSGTDTVKLTVVRSYDPKTLYHHPELAVAYGPSYAKAEVRRFTLRPEIPVHMVYANQNGGAVAMYVLLYDGRFVEDPIWFQMRTAGELLFSGRKAMTLFFVTDENVSATADVDALPSSRLLFASIDQFLAPSASASVLNK